MKKTYILLLLMFAAAAQSLAVDYQTTVDKIWGGRNFQELNGACFGVNRTDGPTAWPQGSDGVTVVYALRVPAGHVRADILLTPRIGRTATVNLAVVCPETGDTITTHTAVSDSTQARGEQRLELMPDVVFPRDTWYRFELTTPQRTDIRQVNCLEFQREAKQAVGDSPIFMAPSVHLFSYSTTDADAPDGESYDWVYLEVMYPSQYERPNTYVMSIGTDAGYSGVQSIWDGKGGYNHQVLFSVWDNGDTDSDPYLPDYLRSGALDKGPDVYITRFGGEGTGTSARYPTGHWWQTDHWVQFLLNGRPEQVAVEVTGEDGKPQTITYDNTIESMWYKMDNETEWHYIASLRESGRNHLYSSFYSFIENFTDEGGELFRRAYFRHPAMRSTASGRWYARTKVSYGHTQGDGSRFSRTDYGHGVTEAYDDCFYMQTGGFVAQRDSANTLDLPADMVWVDTIDLVPLTAQVNRAIINSEAERMQDLIRAAGGRLERVKAIAASLLADAGRFGSYSPADLVRLAEVFDEGQVTDLKQLTNALNALAADATPLKYGIVGSVEKISSFYTYQLRNLAGRGVLVVADDGTLTVGESAQSGALAGYMAPLDVTEPDNNWLILRSEKYGEYYLYNLGKHLFLKPGTPHTLSAEPVACPITRSSTGFLLGPSSSRISIDATKEVAVVKGGSPGDGTRFELRHNFAMDLDETTVRRLLTYAEEFLHGGSGLNEGKAFQHPEEKNTGAWHDLQGRVVNKPTTGLYVIAGRKVFIH
ncbi:MAG: DUF3472 domain-containing protein [Bacteroidaceae bacterium]|nr:DUF3472 domain-containing protein [Bacteroidaceae bacterium]